MNLLVTHQKNERVSIVESESKRKKMKYNAPGKKNNQQMPNKAIATKKSPLTIKKEVPNKTLNDKERSH
ncbi:26781_t:CDS:2 [Gigaspora margarita]|uniref:26781_t:CDS:1 n=1 Tax=Gigaspora margarita TaxID=4874 RepID=A0ABN7UET5_GIGMA|nr:26781_t:CDS:2 [Gigaspora margarita]